MKSATQLIERPASAKRLAGLTGAHLLHEMLLAEGVDILFGYPGAAVIPIFDVLYDSPIRYVQTRHEQGAAHMADGYARGTGKVGVCLATSGPGATNLVTGLATANMDSIPMVAITGQVRSTAIGSDAFQEADVTGITRPITKHNFLVTKIDDLARTVREAFHIARTGRPGPVLVDICVDASLAKIDHEPAIQMRLGGYKSPMAASMRQIQAAAEAINASSRPLAYVGGGIIHAGAAEALRQFIDKTRIPVTTTLLGLGTVDESHAMSLKMLGMHGSPTANYAVQNCDLLIAIGARFDDRVTAKVETFAPHAKIIHIDIDPASISKNIEVDIPVVGDARDVLQRLLPLVTPADRSPWLERIAQWKREHPFRYRNAEGVIKPQQVIESIGRMTDHDAIIATGVGQHQMWTAQYYGFRRPRQLISSGGLGTMGFGVPAAIGAQFGNPGATVIDIDGDGSFCMTMQEVITAVHYQQPVKFVVLDNSYLGMVRQWQELFWKKRYSGVHHPCPDFATVANGFGAKGMRVEDPSELDDALSEMLRHEGPVVLSVQVEKEENVYPMVPAGKSLDEMEFGTLA